MDSIAFFEVFPDFFLTDEFHKTPDECIGSAWHGFARDRILTKKGFEEVVATCALRHGGKRLEYGIFDHFQNLSGY